MLYTVMVGFVVAGVWGDFERVADDVQQEAAKLESVADGADLMGDALAAAQVRSLVQAYAAEVVDVEWPAMAAGDRSERAHDLLGQLRSAVAGAPGADQTGRTVQESQLRHLEVVDELRSSRLVASGQGLPQPLWLVLTLTGLATMGVTLRFGLRESVTGADRLTVGATAAVIALTLLAVALLDYPFVGDLAVTPEGFATLREATVAVPQG